LHSDKIHSQISELRAEIRCAICKKNISSNDLVYLSPDESKEFIAHFSCYVEVQDKICSICCLPFFDKEELLYCEEHKEYFHNNSECIKNHLSKHIRFKKAIFDASNNRVIFQEDSDCDYISL
jgi:hypothetical protein